MWRRYEYTENGSNKFWEIERVADDVHVRWGRIGTKGQARAYSFHDEGRARHFAMQKCDEKKRKGYRLVDKRKTRNSSTNLMSKKREKRDPSWQARPHYPQGQAKSDEQSLVDRVRRKVKDKWGESC